jgi:NADH-quinone oxidoreductase subunit G
MVRVTVDGRDIETAEGTPLLQAMLDAGMDIPHYCYHPKLTIDGSCRLCQVKIEGMPKLQISCNTTVRDGMKVDTLAQEVAEARRGVIELLLLNHPLDCPICDKAGECWLQNYSMRFGSRLGRTIEPRRKHGKRMDIGERMLLDQERCILCRRCVRFCREISKTGELVIFNQAEQSVLDIYDQRLDNAYSMCTADICPVGALETKDFHHKIRTWFLEETASVCPGCSNGCNIMICHHLDRIWRLVPRRNDEVNDTWMCDAGRFTYKPLHGAARVFVPTVMRDGQEAAVNWDEALEAAANGLRRVADQYGGAAIGAVVSPHLTLEDNFHFRKMLDALGVTTTAMAVVRGDSDDFLIKAEKAPNARGVRELGLVSGGDDGVENLLSAAESGKLKALYVCGSDLVQTVEPARLERIAERMEFIVAHTMIPFGPLARATVTIPATAFAEKTGTFVNHAGRAQRIQQAINLPPGWYNDASVFVAIRNRLRSEYHRFDLRETWREIAQAHPAFASIEQLHPAAAQLGGVAAQTAAA